MFDEQSEMFKEGMEENDVGRMVVDLMRKTTIDIIGICPNELCKCNLEKYFFVFGKECQTNYCPNCGQKLDWR